MIVPIFRVESHLHRCVDSILEQSYARLEVILVDDGSPDRCGEICDEYAMKDPRVQVIHQANAGVSAARNVGLDVASGGLLMFVDADDWVDPDIITHLLAALTEHGADMAACGFQRVATAGESDPASEGEIRILSTHEALNLYAGPLSDALTAPWGKLYRATLFEGTRFPLGRLYEDEYVTYRVVSRARTIALSSARLYKYFVRADSTTQRPQDAAQVLDRARALWERGDYFRGLGLAEAAAVSYRKAFLLLRLAGRLEREAGNMSSLHRVTADVRRLAMSVVRADLPLSFKVFAGAYAAAARPVDRVVGAARRAGWAVPGTRTDGARLHATLPAGSAVPAAVGAAPEPVLERQLEIIVVAYGAPDLLRDALEPVSAFPVTVVDNSSLPEIAKICADLGCRYIDSGRNGGFAFGVNIGLAHRAVAGSDVLLLNPDAVISHQDVVQLHAALLAEPDLASVGPAQVDASGKPSRVSWPFPSPIGTWAEALGLHRTQWRAPTYVIGSVLLLRAEAIDEVGTFDEQFFLYSEEADWAYRAHRKGWRHEVVVDAQALHVGGATSSDEARRAAHFHGSQERYLRKHHGSLGWQAARLGQIMGDSMRAAVRTGSARSRAKRRAALYLQGPSAVEADLVAGLHQTETIASEHLEEGH